MAQPAYNLRSSARVAAVQALYQFEMTEQTVQSVMTEFSQAHLAEWGAIDMEFFTALVSDVVAHQSSIDTHICEHLSQNWNFSRLDRVLRAILRALTCEFAYREAIPALVCIDEYINVTDCFFDKKTVNFVNGFADKLARKLRTHELEPTGALGSHE